MHQLQPQSISRCLCGSGFDVRSSCRRALGGIHHQRHLYLADLISNNSTRKPFLPSRKEHTSTFYADQRRLTRQRPQHPTSSSCRQDRSSHSPALALLPPHSTQVGRLHHLSHLSSSSVRSSPYQRQWGQQSAVDLVIGHPQGKESQS